MVWAGRGRQWWCGHGVGEQAPTSRSACHEGFLSRAETILWSTVNPSSILAEKKTYSYIFKQKVKTIFFVQKEAKRAPKGWEHFLAGAVVGGEFCCLTEAEGKYVLFLSISLSSLLISCEIMAPLQIPLLSEKPLSHDKSLIPQFHQDPSKVLTVMFANIFLWCKSYSKDASGMAFLLFRWGPCRHTTQLME